MNPHPVELAGTGMSVPAFHLASSDADAAAGRPRGWLAKACGVEGRFVRSGDETQEGLAAAACLKALDEASLRPGDVDLVISASSVSRQPIPAMAPLIAREIGILNGGCASFDVNATCLGFLTGFDVAAALIATGRHQRALVVSSEIASRALPWERAPEVAGLFGDGAAAAVLRQAATGRGMFRAAYFESHPDGYELCQIRSGGTAIDYRGEPDLFMDGSLFEMDGRGLFRLTSERFPAFLAHLLAKAGWRREDVDLVVPHQASRLALRHLIERCGFPEARVVDIVGAYGNQVAASVPTALHLARQANRIQTGAKVLLLGTSAGVMFGGLALEF